MGYRSSRMGPAILLDKSPFQKCPRHLLPELFRHYALVVPPILLKEILEDHAESPQRFFALAKRLDFMDVSINLSFQRMLEGELLGNPVPMSGQPCMAAKTINSAEGLLHVFSDPPEAEALRRWQKRVTSAAERDAAIRWQTDSDGFDMEGFTARLRKVADGLPRFRGDKESALQHLALFVDKLLALPDQLQFLELALLEFGEDFRKRVRARWHEVEPSSLQEFAPYAHYCLRLRFIFALALTNGHISTHHNSLLDLEYLYFLPFCQIFCSDDKKLHNVIQSVLLRPDQTFLDYVTLERALHETFAFFGQLSSDRMREWLDSKGHYPPCGPFITQQMYDRHWKLPAELQGNFAKKLPQALVDSVIRKVKAARAELGEQAPPHLTIVDPSEPAESASRKER